jgi:hypothetical protein
VTAEVVFDPEFREGSFVTVEIGPRLVIGGHVSFVDSEGWVYWTDAEGRTHATKKEQIRRSPR